MFIEVLTLPLLAGAPNTLRLSHPLGYATTTTRTISGFRFIGDFQLRVPCLFNRSGIH
jgi:hypothetical protein